MPQMPKSDRHAHFIQEKHIGPTTWVCHDQKVLAWRQPTPTPENHDPALGLDPAAGWNLSDELKVSLAQKSEEVGKQQAAPGTEQGESGWYVGMSTTAEKQVIPMVQYYTVSGKEWKADPKKGAAEKAAAAATSGSAAAKPVMGPAALPPTCVELDPEGQFYYPGAVSNDPALAGPGTDPAARAAAMPSHSLPVPCEKVKDWRTGELAWIFPPEFTKTQRKHWKWNNRRICSGNECSYKSIDY